MSGNKAYTLLEVLVAFAITASILAVLLPAQSSTIRRGVSELEQSIALDYAYSVLAQMSVEENILETDRSFSFGDWQVVTRATSSDVTGDRQVTRLTVVVLDTTDAPIASAEGLFAE